MACRVGLVGSIGLFRCIGRKCQIYTLKILIISKGMSKTPKCPRDTNQLAKFIVDVATDEAELPENEPTGKNAAAVELGRLGGKR